MDFSPAILAALLHIAQRKEGMASSAAQNADGCPERDPSRSSTAPLRCLPAMTVRLRRCGLPENGRASPTSWCGLGTRTKLAIVRWVEEHGFVDVRADPRECRESLEDPRRSRVPRTGAGPRARHPPAHGDALRSETERLLSLPAGLFDEVKNDPDQPMSGPALARTLGIAVPEGTTRWPDAGAHVQALYGLIAVLQAPLERFLRVQTTIAPTGDGMRLQGAIVAQGPLATAYLQMLDKASWPAVTYASSLLRIDWRTPRRCGRCGTNVQAQATRSEVVQRAMPVGRLEGWRRCPPAGVGGSDPVVPRPATKAGDTRPKDRAAVGRLAEDRPCAERLEREAQ